MVRDHFVDDSLLTMTTEKEYIITTMQFLALFCKELGAIVSDTKIDYQIIGLNDPPTWIPTSWNFVQLGVIVKYLGILLAKTSYLVVLGYLFYR